MDEADYWDQLRLRINQAPGLPGGWCDWLTARQYLCVGPSPRIIGRAGFVSGRKVNQRKLELFLRREDGSSDEIKWAELLPADDAADWITLDPLTGCLEIRPRVSD